MDLQGLLKKHNFFANKLLGQNFLTDDLALEKIVAAADLKSDDEVLEIGSGIGNLTALLSEKAGYVLSVEKDQRYFPILKEQLGNKLMRHNKTPKPESNVELIFSDIMSFNFQSLLAPGYKVVANIPYYITGKIVEMLMLAENKPSKIVLLMQKEVAQRIVAKAGELSILAISVQLFSQPKFITIIPKENFYPQPKVDSAVLVLEMLPNPKFDIDEKKFFRIIKAAFSGKRKQIKNTLKNNLLLSEQQLTALAQSKIINLKDRPQDLSLEQWYQLYKFLEK